MSAIIVGKVARILNSRHVALNIGSNNGVCPGMNFDILDPIEDVILDPDTGEALGSFRRPKVRVRVTIVQGKMCLAETYRTNRVNVGGSGFGGTSNLFSPPKWETRYETLKTDEQTWESLSEEYSYVKTGDPVIQVVEDSK